jgi:hypothetical protein
MKRDARDMREMRDPKFEVLGSKFRKPRTSNPRSVILLVLAGQNCLWVWR